MIDRTLVLPSSPPRVPRLPTGKLNAPPRTMERHMHREEAQIGGVPQRPAVRRRASARHAQVAVLDARMVAVVLGVLAALGLIGATLTFVVDVFVAPWRIY